ncbi:hypothetical protein BG452_25525 [Streptomyces sp. CBMA123]|nr:hypothetical protein [Streptomyces sp. CBMA123]
MSQRWRARFVADYADFALASCQEADLRRAGNVLSLDAYLTLRRRTITLLPMADILERTGHALMPDSPSVRARMLALRLATAVLAPH